MKITGIILSIILAAGILWADHDDDIGRLYLKEAAFLFEAGDYSESEKLLNIAGEFISGESDMLYLLGRLSGIGGHSLKDPVRYYREASNIGNWKIYSASELGRQYIPILFQSKQYSQCLEMLSNPDFNPEPSSHFIWMHGRTLIHAGRMADAVDVVKEGLAFYPDSALLYGLLFELAPVERERYKQLLLTGTINQPELKSIILPLLISGMKDVDSALFSKYDEMELFDLGAEIKRIRLFGLQSPDKLGELTQRGLFTSGVLSRELVGSLPFNSQRDEVRELFNTWTGTILEDSNNDGWSEISIEIREGLTETVIWDPDQYGEWSLKADYENGIPVSVSIYRESGFFIEYELYPWVRRITLRDEEKIFVYNLTLGSFSLPFPQINPIEEPVVMEMIVPDWEKINDSSRNIIVYSPGTDSPLEEYIPIFNRGWRTAGYKADEADFRRNFYIRNGSIEYEEQDLTGGSGWDTARYYQEGFLKLIAHDAREDGIFEYAESVGEYTEDVGEYTEDVGEYTEDGWFFWDFNQNGYYDCRERRINKTILREYSSEDNGYYDILIEIEGNE